VTDLSMTPSARPSSGAARRLRASVLAMLALLALGQIRLFDRLLYEGRPEFQFVVESVNGVLGGHPVSKSWAHRLLAPALVAGLARVGGWERARAVRLFGEAMIALAIVALYALVRRKGAGIGAALAAVVTFGLAHALLVYKLEYPWDGIDVLLFLAFGAWAARGGDLARAWPLLVVGLFNHETVIYIPLWYLLSPLDGGPARWRELGAATLVMALLLCVIALLRHWLYVARPELPEQWFEHATPVIENHLHVGHNVRALFIENWRGGRAFNSIVVLAAVTVFVFEIVRRGCVRAAVWSLVVMVTVLCFGYLNETRHYLSLMAFWVTYRWPARDGVWATS
jgi:hypothetical protein